MTPRARTRKWLSASFLCLLLGAGLASPAHATPAWLAPVDLSAAGHQAEVPQVAVDASGDAVVVWQDSDGVDHLIRAASRAAGGTWAAPVDLSAAGGRAYDPQVAANAAGEVVVVWERSDGANFIVQAATRSAGGDWGPAVDLSAAGQDASRPQVALDPAGGVEVVWTRLDGAHHIVQAASRGAAGGWSAPVSLSASGHDAYYPQVGVDAAGDAVAVWNHHNGAEYIAQAATKPAGGAWGAPVDLSAVGEDADRLDLAVDAAGDAVAVWERSDGTDEIVQASSRPAGGAWGAPINLSAPGQDAVSPQVAMADGGEAVTVWRRSDGAKYVVQAASKPAGGGWGAPVDLSVPDRSSYAPQLAVDAAGDAAAVWWRAGDGLVTTIQASTRPRGGDWGSASDLSALGELQNEPEVTIDPDGDAVAVWERSDGTNEIIQSAVYDATGPQLRSLSIPTGGVVGRPLAFSVSPFDVWSSLGVTTWSFGDGAGASGSSASHSYGVAGSYTVTVTGADALGNAHTASGTVAIAAAPRGRAWARRIVKVRRGKALVAMSCPAAADCTGLARMVVTAKTHGAKASRRRRPRLVTIGKAAFSIAAATSKNVKIPLTRRGRALLAGGGRERLSARLTGSGVTARAVTLESVGRNRRHR